MLENKQPHESAVSHVTGQAQYVDDRTLLRNEVFLDVFYSSQACARIKSLDLSECLKCPGVIKVYTAKDIKNNQWGPVFQDQPLLALDQVEYVGEAIAVIVASSKEVLKTAKSKIKIEYEKKEAMLTIDQSISKQAFVGPCRQIKRGDVELALKNATHRLKGEISIAGQDHFYLESQASVAYPKEAGQIEVHSSSQHPTETQHIVAHALGLKYSDVVCVVKRMGGAFGGKESQAAPFAVYAALAASDLKRPARVILTKDDDMIMTGKRNPFKNFYEVGFDDSGKITALDARLYSDSGAYADLSTAIMERAMLHLDNAYYIPNFKVEGRVCKTNTPPNTAFRGFGGPKGVATIESLIEDIAFYLKKDPLEIRKLNVYQKGQTTPYGQEIDDDVLPKLFEQLEKNSSYELRRKEIKDHNQNQNKTYRGISMTAVKFGISFTTRFYNQANALVNLHLDGTIQVSTGATEMGQGVNTKIAQVVAQCFSIPVSYVRVMATSTEKNPNTSATAASSGSDLNGQAALCAALQIRERLAKVAIEVFKRPDNQRGKPFAASGVAEEINIDDVSGWEEICFEDAKVFHAAHPSKKISLQDLIYEAYLSRQKLTEQGFFKIPEIHFNKETGQGRPFFYFTNGVAVTEVSIDRFTGELKILRTDVLMDLGRPINKEIDLGQVTGGFVQGAGWMTTENLHYEEGLLVTHSPSTYKIPSVHDIPREFNCELIENLLNMRNLKGSKAVGEPPLLLSISVWTAIKDALSSATKKQITSLQIPATQERIYMQLKEGVL